MSRNVHVLIFLALFAVILLTSHFYLYARISHYLQLTPPQRRWVAIILTALGLLTLLSIPLSRLLPLAIARALSWIIFPWMGFLLLMLAVMVATDLAWIVFNLVKGGASYDPARRMLIQRAFGVAALGTTAALGSFSLWNGLRSVEVKPITITLDKLSKSHDGLKIVQITDLHIGPLIEGEWMRQVVDKVNALTPDLIAITGDLVDGSIPDLGKFVASLADLKAPLGVYFITGNHEYYSGADVWCAHVASLGIKVLRNERVSITAGDKGETFDLAGVDDWGSRQMEGQGPDLLKALSNRDPTKMLLLLAHQPAAVEEASQNGVDLQLSGHTHGGQIWPFTYLVYLQQPYVEGLYRHKNTNTQIYVSPGTGFWGPPMRFGTSAEITEITLRARA